MRAAIRFPLAFLVVCAVTALPVTPAGATPPTVVVEPFDVVEVVPAGAACAFDVTIHHEGTITTTTFYDRDGTPMRELIRYGDHFAETYSANGKSLTTISVSPGHSDLTTGVTTGTGLQRHVIIPGAGVVYGTAGRYVFVTGVGDVLSFSGLDVPPGEELCAALSP